MHLTMKAKGKTTDKVPNHQNIGLFFCLISFFGLENVQALSKKIINILNFSSVMFE